MKTVTRRDRFLAEIERLTLWAALEAELGLSILKLLRGRPLIGLVQMLRMHIVQQCFGLTEEAVDDSQAIPR